MASNQASIRDYGLAAPHGPNMQDRHVATQNIGDMSENELGVFQSLLKPDDSYTADGVYWADLPLGQRVKFVSSVDAVESKREFGAFWSMFKKDPLAPVGWYFRNAVIPGAGLGLEGYVLFSIGNLTSLFDSVYPHCWDSKAPETCSKTWVAAVTYLEIVGIIVGQILVGFLGDYLGRRYGLIQDATIMFIGLLMLTASWGTTENGWVICYAWASFFYGVGVGGEYPMTATSGMENAVGSGKVSTREDRLHRGRKVTSAFLMQGWGQLFNSILLILLLLIFHGSGNPPYSKTATQWTYRVSFAIPAVGTLWLVYYRTFKMRAASKTLLAAKRKAKVTGYDTESLKLTFSYFGSRVLATAGCWFANDVFFYGNKLFESDFIAALLPDNKSVMVTWLYNLLNVGVSLVGYYMATFFIDNKLYGRRNMMIVGFLMDFILFIVPAFHYKYYDSKAHAHAFQAMYFLSSFFNQFGPNAVTFIVAAEVYPTPIRATAHGFSAAIGKLGALFASVLYAYITTQQKFYVVPWFGLLGVVLTVLFLPDTTGLDLKEQERRWAYIRAGRASDYHGIAIHPRHLSYWERWRGVGKPYDAELDYQQRVEEMRHDWEEAQQRRADAEKAHGDDVEDEDWHSDLSSYFQRTKGVNTATPTLNNEKSGREGSSDDDTAAR